jgi:uncharacterized protein YhbP (UPF0306 family)
MAMGKNLLSKAAENNIASHDSGVIFNKTHLVKYNFQSAAASYYIWSQNRPREVLLSEEQSEHIKLIKHFLSQTAIADYLIKNTGE